MKDKIFQIVSKIMEIPLNDINIDSSPDTIANWDSLRHIKLILAIEEILNIQFSDDEIVSITNVRSLIDNIEKREI